MLMELSIFPLDRGVSLSTHVARVVDLIDRSGLACRTGPMGTVVEGDMDQLLGLLRHCHSALEADCDRIYTTVKFDYHKGARGRLQGKLDSLRQKLGRDIP